MADIVFGQPVRTGDLNQHPHSISITGTKGDGTRRITDKRHYQLGPGGSIRAEFDGYLASRGVRGIVTTDAQLREDGRWLTFPNEDGNSVWSDEPVTPGDDFYRFRRHVGQASDHFDSRFVPARLNQRKATAHRLFEIAQELSPEDRDKVSNVSLKERSDNGYLWRRIHAFVPMPFGTAANDVAWRRERDRLDILLHAHCDRCARIIDVALDHPSEEWKGYLDKQIRFHSAADGDNHVIPDTSWLTPEVVTNDIANYNAAGRFFRTPAMDDDFLAPRSAPIPAPAGQATVPYFGGANSFRRTEMIAHWRKEITDLRASSNGSNFQKRMFYWFAASNILALYRPENNDGPGLGYLTLNRRAVRSTDVIEDGDLTTLGEALYRHYYPDLQSLSDTPWFMRARLFLAPANILITEPGNLLTIPPNEINDDGTWRADMRAQWATTLNDMLGFTVLGATGPVEV